MIPKHCLSIHQAYAASICREYCSSTMHVTRRNETYAELLTSENLSHPSIARRGAERFSALGDEISRSAAATRGPAVTNA